MHFMFNNSSKLFAFNYVCNKSYILLFKAFDEKLKEMQGK